MTNEELQIHMHSRPNPWGGFYPAPRIVCKDGFSLSVQASPYHYCSPRSDTGPYTHVEVGEPVPELEPYSDGEGDVFAQVPIELVLNLIEKNGGLYGAV